MRMNLPNILTILRLLSAPGIALIFLFVARPWAHWAALALFIGASLTDYLDGWLARRWHQQSKLGAMLDPIADKAMIVVALMVLAAVSGLNTWVILPATAILFREVFVSGLREYLGDTAGLLKVTKLAKWKTTAQMVAISVLLARGLFVHYFGMWTYGMGPEITAQVLAGEIEDVYGLRWVNFGMIWSYWIGLVLLWVAAGLTLITGADYFIKARPFLKDGD